MQELIASIFMFFAALFGGGESAVPDEVVPTAYPDEISGIVTGVIDGDTIDVLINGATQRVRYIGIDSPETDECYSGQAQVANKALVDNKPVRLIADKELRDDYGRMLRYVYVGDTFVNQKLIEDGFADVMAIAPNTAYYGHFKQLRDQAQTEGRGLWGACGA